MSNNTTHILCWAMTCITIIFCVFGIAQCDQKKLQITCDTDKASCTEILDRWMNDERERIDGK